MPRYPYNYWVHVPSHYIGGALVGMHHICMGGTPHWGFLGLVGMTLSDGPFDFRHNTECPIVRRYAPKFSICVDEYFLPWLRMRTQVLYSGAKISQYI